jgi:serine/threonine protein kinase
MITCIPESQMTKHNKEGKVIGSGSYGSCELMHWKNIPVCVKRAHKTIELPVVKKEAVILHQLQRSLFVPVLLGINVAVPPFYIVTKFHSIASERSLTLQKSINNCTIGKKKWASILLKCAEGIKSIHGLGYIHNDLHQKNIILDRLNGHVHPVIIDFGKACRLDDGRCRKVQDSDQYNKQHPWIAPETISGEHKESEASDVYSLGYIMGRINSQIKCNSLGELVSLCQGKMISRPKINDIIGSLRSVTGNWSNE